jgi:lipoyl synthase
MGEISRQRLPHWMKMQRAGGDSYITLKRLTEKNQLNTICSSGNCPNIGECWNAGMATFMILGNICTRSCKFCMVSTGKPLPPDFTEPLRIAESVRILNLKHCVITSVDRDDLHDGGASFWAETIKIIKEKNPGTSIEALIPDFDGRQDCLDRIIAEKSGLVSHNLETVKRLTPDIRSKAKYQRSLGVLKYLSSKDVMTKSGIMLGLGESRVEILETMDDLISVGCLIMTLGQYLQPSLGHMQVKDYIKPEVFEEYQEIGLKKGFTFVESGPLVRSSYHSEKHLPPAGS